MYRATWKSLLSHKLRLAMSLLAIVLAVAFVSGSLQFTDVLSQSVNGILKGSTADIEVGPAGRYDDVMSETSDNADVRVTPENLEAIRKVPGVVSADGFNAGQTLYPLDSKGRLLGYAQAPTITASWIDAPAAGGQQGIVIKSGHAPGDGEVLLDPTALAGSGYSEGDTLTAVDPTTNTRHTFKIVGTATWGSGSTMGATYMFVSPKTAQQLITGGKDVFLSGWVVTEPGADAAAIARDINKVLPTTLQAVDADFVAEKTMDVINSGLAFVNIFLLVFAAIALVVATFLIINTFSIIVAQRSRELALFRAMGASRGQVQGSVLFEALIIGAIGATLGIGVGWLLAMGITATMGALGMNLGGALPTLTPVAIGVSYGVGILVTMIAAWVPAIRASRVPPVAAMTGEYMTGNEGMGRRSVFAGVMIALGAVGLIGGVAGWLPEAVACIGVGALLILVGVAIASPLLGRPVTWLLGHLYRAVFGTVGQLAELNASRNPRRTAATASALMIGLALVVSMGILGQSAKTSLAGIVSSSFRGDLIVSTVMSPMAPSVGDKIAKVDGVAELYRSRHAGAKIGDSEQTLAALSPEGFSKATDATMTQGSLKEGVNSIVLNETWAKDQGYSVGSKISSRIGSSTVELTVDGLFTAPELVSPGNVVTNLTTLEAAGVQPLDSAYTLYVASGRSVSEIKDKVGDAVADLPLISVSDVESVTEQNTAAVDQMLAVIYALLGLAIVIAVLGIVNTLALSVIERTREIGLLRAIGLTRRQLRRMINLESVVVALLGAVLGIGLGLAFGVALQRPLADQGLDQLDIPWGMLAAFLGVSIIVGVLAALWPARRASRLNVLEAISTD